MHIIICGYYGLKLIEIFFSSFLFNIHFVWFLHNTVDFIQLFPKSDVSIWERNDEKTQFKIVVAITSPITNRFDSSDAMRLFFFSIYFFKYNSAKRKYRISRFAIFFTLFLLPISVCFVFSIQTEDIGIVTDS